MQGTRVDTDMLRTAAARLSQTAEQLTRSSTDPLLPNSGSYGPGPLPGAVERFTDSWCLARTQLVDTTTALVGGVRGNADLYDQTDARTSERLRSLPGYDPVAFTEMVG